MGNGSAVAAGDVGTQCSGIEQGLAAADEMANVAKDASGPSEVIEGGKWGISGESARHAMC